MKKHRAFSTKPGCKNNPIQTPESGEKKMEKRFHGNGIEK
jgi:hypothetical protein